MSIEIKVPNLGDGIESGDVLTVLVREGDTIQAEQGIVELETDKAVAEVPSPHAGRVSKIHVRAGDAVQMGTTLITLQADSVPTETKEKLPTDQQVEPQVVSKAEDRVEPDIPQAPVSSPPQPSPAALHPPESESRDAIQQTGGSDLHTEHDVAAGPSIRRFARQLGVDLETVKGTGPGGRITKKDVQRTVREANRAALSTTDVPPASHEEAPQVLPPGDGDEDAWGPIRIDRLSRIRATIAANMLKSKSTAPHVTNFDDADVTELEEIRQSSKKDYADSGIKLTSMPFIVKSVALALCQHPDVNSSIDVEEGKVIYKLYVNVGIAVDTERGLMVPVIRGADTMRIPQIARSLAELAEKARGGKIGIEEMRGGTFTISNLGAIGGTYSTPIINVPEVAILLVGRSREMPVAVHGRIEPRLMMPLSLSYDHRMVDGAVAARFLNEVKGYLEAPGRLLLAP